MSTCWVCGGQSLSRVKASDLHGDLGSEHFKITDTAYGTTGAIDRCGSCGFLQCTGLENLVNQYETMQDDGYESSAEPRSLQARKLVEAALEGRDPNGLRLLDVGAGSGLLLEQAQAAGLYSEGIEPSRWLYDHAKARGLRIQLGVLPHPNIGPNYDIVTVVDVIEHVDDPVGLMTEVARLLAPGGRCLVVTPDVSSLAARAMGWRWWHFRVAHVGYFNRKTLTLALGRAGLTPLCWFRPVWYFPLQYLFERVQAYLPGRPKWRLPDRVAKWVVPINLFDSHAVIVTRSDA